MQDPLASVRARALRVLRADPESVRQPFVIRLRLRLGALQSQVLSPSRTVRRRFAARGLDERALIRGGAGQAARNRAWRLRSQVAHLPGATPAWEWLKPRLAASRTQMVRTDRLLLGALNGTSAADFARAIGDPLYSSTRLVDSPLVAVLRDHEENGAEVLADENLARSPYVARAKAFRDVAGHYIGARTDEEILGVTREFVEWYGEGRVVERPARGSGSMPPVVRRVQHSDCYTILDGHHRLAAEAQRGASEVKVAVALGSTTTALQDHLLRMAWLDGRRELYQPIEAPELETWVLARRCTDRLDMATAFLEGRELLPPSPGARYLDVGSCYGWFVREFQELGYEAHGVEADPRARELGEMVYRLSPDQVVTSEATAYLQRVDQPFEVVSCFSVLHHFALGRGPCSAAEFMRLLSHVTRSVLFFDTGEGHERWMRSFLPHWTPAFIQEWILAHSGFREVIPLGVDGDARPPYADNYGRTLFACVK